MGTEYETYQAYLQALIVPDTEADFATVIGLRILTQVNISIPIPLQSLYIIISFYTKFLLQ